MVANGMKGEGNGEWGMGNEQNIPHPHPPSPLASLPTPQLARRCTGLLACGILPVRFRQLALLRRRVVRGWL